MDKNLKRREFIGLSTVAAAGLLIACNSDKKPRLQLAAFADQAPDGPELKVGLIGCGDRGTGAAINFLNSGPNLSVRILGDLLPDRIEKCRQELKNQKNIEVASEFCYTGFDAYLKVLESDVDIVLLATPPHFRPEHFAAAINAKKHVFMEKPVAVDPVGARSIIASSRQAQAMGLCVGTGTQRRHQRDYVETYKHIYAGAIGEIVGGNCYWNQEQLWFKLPQPGWTEMEYMIRDWVNWTWLSGDHIVEQHVHNIDVINWFTGLHPVKAVGFGSRLRRPTGNQYDFFSVDFTYEGDIHVHSMCRQIKGCSSNVSEYIRGTKGFSNAQNTIYNMDGSIKWKYEYPLDKDGKPTDRVKISPYDQEHIDLVTAIRTNKPYVEAEATAIATLAAIMGRISAYTGKEVTWEEVMSLDQHLVPKEYKLGPVEIDKSIPIAGTAE